MAKNTWDTEAGAHARARIVELRRDHVEFEDIGRLLWEAGEWPTPLKQPPTRQAVWQQWRRTLATIPAPSLGALRADLMERLEEQYRRAEELLNRHHIAHSNGVVVRLDGKPLEDPGPALAALREQRGILAEIAVLTGARAPVRQQVTVDAEVKYSVVGIDPEALT